MSQTLVKPDEIATTLGVCVRTVRRWFANGILPPPIRLGRRVLRLDRDTWERYLQSQKSEH